MKISWDSTHQRIIAAGLDQQMKFFEVIKESEELQLRLQYKIKLPQAVMEFAISADGQHFIIGLIDGSFLIKSKHLEEFQEEQDDETKMIMSAFKFEYKSKAKGYKYFFRGQYSAMPEPEDIISGMKSRKQKLQKYEQSLKQFQYKKALNEAIEQQNPEVVLALIEELIHRGALEIALSNRSEDELQKLVAFIKWKISDYRYQTVLL